MLMTGSVRERARYCQRPPDLAFAWSHPQHWSRGDRPGCRGVPVRPAREFPPRPDRKSTRLNSSHLGISYAVFCLKKKRTRSSGTSSHTMKKASSGKKKFSCSRFFFFFNDTATTEIYTLSLHDALPICTRIPSSP